MDLRVPMGPLFAAFGVSAVVRVAGNPAVNTTAIWLSPTLNIDPSGFSVEGRSARRVMTLQPSAVPSIPEGTLIDAPEVKGGPVITWRTEGDDVVEADQRRVIVVEDQP